MMAIVFEPEARETTATERRPINKWRSASTPLIKDVTKTPFSGIGKPEIPKGDYTGFRSRRIDQVHRPVYAVKDKRLPILQCRFHCRK